MPDPSFRDRLTESRRLEEQSLQVAAAVGGLGLFGAGDLASTVFGLLPGWLLAAFVATALVGGGLAGRAWGGFRWHQTLVESEREREDKKPDDTIPAKAAHDLSAAFEGPVLSYRLALIFVLVAAFWLLLAVGWYAAVKPPPAQVFSHPFGRFPVPWSVFSVVLFAAAVVYGVNYVGYKRLPDELAHRGFPGRIVASTSAIILLTVLVLVAIRCCPGR